MKFWHYLWLALLGWSLTVYADDVETHAPTLTDLSINIKQSENEVLSQIDGEPEMQIIGYFDAKTAKIHTKPRQNSQFVRKLWGKNANGDFILQDFYLHDDSDNQPMTSAYILPKKQNPKRKAIMGRVQAAALAWYRETGLPEKVMLFDENQRMNKVYHFDETGSLSKMLDFSDNLSMWLFYEGGSPKIHVSGLNLQAWYNNGQMRLLSQQNGDSQIWHENGQLYYQNTENKIAFFHENGQTALELVDNQISAWDKDGTPITANRAATLKQHLSQVKQTRDDVLNEIKINSTY